MKCSSWQNTWPSQVERNLAFQFVYRKWSSSRFIKVTALFPFLQVLEAQGHRTHNTYKRSLRFSMRSWHLTENPAHVVQMMLTCTRYYQNMENRKILGAFVNIFRSKITIKIKSSSSCLQALEEFVQTDDCNMERDFRMNIKMSIMHDKMGEDLTRLRTVKQLFLNWTRQTAYISLVCYLACREFSQDQIYLCYQRNTILWIHDHKLYSKQSDKCTSIII